jgi:hypothetical protein
MNQLETLLCYATEISTITHQNIPETHAIIGEINALLSRCNGFYALGKSIWFLSSDPNQEIHLNQWNVKETWLEGYGEAIPAGALAFAMDLFGNQFMVVQGGVYLFNIETAELEHVADSLEGWAEQILNDGYWSGCSLYAAWLEEKGEIPKNHRLAPKILFMMGGKFTISNLYPNSVAKIIAFSIDIFHQTKDIPDGTQIKIKIQ